MRIENLPCSLGTVLDLSASGMRVSTSKLSAKHAGEVVPVELNGTLHSAKFMAEVTWGERVGFRKHVVGLRFLNLTEEQLRNISAIARTYAIRMGMGA
jgi:PilZ domain